MYRVRGYTQRATILYWHRYRFTTANTLYTCGPPNSGEISSGPGINDKTGGGSVWVATLTQLCWARERNSQRDAPARRQTAIRPTYVIATLALEPVTSPWRWQVVSVATSIPLPLTTTIGYDFFFFFANKFLSLAHAVRTKFVWKYK